MTNGDKFLEVYHNLYVCVLYLDFNYIHVRDRNVEYDIDDNKTCMKMPIDWWNAEYEALEQDSKTDTWSIKDVADTLAKHGLIVESEEA